MRILWCVWFFTLLCCGAAIAQQDFPVKPVRILSGTAGGSSDAAARLIAQGMTPILGQQVIVDPRPTLIIREVVQKSPPDGYTLLLTANSFYLGPLLQSVSYDPVKDFSPVGLAIRTPSIFVVHPSLPPRSVKDLIALAKAKPGQMNYASVAPGSSYHIGMELFKAMAGVQIVGIPYKGAGPALSDMVAGHIEMMFVTPAAGSPLIRSGRLRALAITSLQPSVLFPEIPTMASQGLPGFEQSSKIGMYAPAKTPSATIDRLNHALVEGLNRTEIKDKFREIGLEPSGSTPQEFAKIMISEMARVGKLIKDAGIHVAN